MQGMPTIRITGPLKSHLPGFAAELARLGFTTGSAEHQLRLLAHLSRWLDDSRPGPGPWTSADIASFVAVRRDQGRRLYRSVDGAGVLVDYLSSCGLIADVPVSLTPAQQVVDDWRDYLCRDRGLASSSVRNYVGAVGRFVEAHVVGGENDLAGLTAEEVTSFLLAACGQGKVGKAKSVATAMRSLLGFLAARGTVSPSLVGAVPSVASWKLTSLPRGLDTCEVDRLLGTCDRRTTVGRRDVAMLMLMARLGLRAGEVAALDLDDLDWRAGEIVVSGKGSRTERLPLPVDVGEAVVGYLRRGRPTVTVQGRALFVRVLAPHGRLSSAAVSMRVCVAARRAGLGDVRAHRLRHAAATRVLAAGAPLAEVGQLLRHDKALTTAIYAKTDLVALREMARPWPGGAA